MPKRAIDAGNRIFFAELLSVSVSRLRATGAIRLEDQWARIPFGEQTKLIGVAHTKFPNGGSWSYFRCPKCGARSRKLWLVDDAPRCRLCLEKLGVRHRAAYGFGRTERLRERDRRVDKLQAMLEGGPMRFKPVPPNWGNRRLDRRNRLTWALQRARIVTRLAQLAYNSSKTASRHCRSCANTNRAQRQPRQSQTSNRFGGPDQSRNSNKPSIRLNQPSCKRCKAAIFERD